MVRVMLAYDVAGTGPAVVLLHSTVCDRRMWDPQWPVLVEAGDIGGAVELNVATWLGPEADEPAREKVRQMQRHALEVQLAAPEEFEPVEVAVDLHAITAPSLVVAGAKDLPDFRQIAAELADLLPGGRLVELAWAGHLPTLERPQELSAMLITFLREAGGGSGGAAGRRVRAGR
jgi:3-oxoadipate enol-lactonase